MPDPFRAGRLAITERDRDYWKAECERLRAELARQMWIVNELDRGHVTEADEAAQQWDSDELLSETYDDFSARAALGEADDE